MTVPTSDNIKDAIAQAASDGVRRASFGAGSSSQSAMSICDQITAIGFSKKNSRRRPKLAASRSNKFSTPSAI